MDALNLKKPLGISPGEWKVCETAIGPAVVAGPGEQGTKLVVAAEGFSAATKARRVADAHLVATAPVLLALVKRMLAGSKSRDGIYGELQEAIDRAHGRIP